jgi:predicted transcriptional regulator
MQILDVTWDLAPPVTAPQVFKVMYPRRELAYCTILQTMMKMAEKGFLTMEKSGPRKRDPFEFMPTMSRKELGLSMIEEIAQRIFRKPLAQVMESI